MKQNELTLEEQVLQQFIENYNESATGSFVVNEASARELNFTEQEYVKILKFLNDKKLINIESPFSGYSLGLYVELSLTAEGIGYFKKQKKEKQVKRIESVRNWINTGLSVIAIIISIIALIVSQ